MDVDYIGAWQTRPDGVSSILYQQYPEELYPMDVDFPVLLTFIDIDTNKIARMHIIGGVDVNTGANKGLECIEDVFPIHGIVPGILLAPNYSQDPEVAAILTAKADDINGCFRCISLCDIDSEIIKKPIDVKAMERC